MRKRRITLQDLPIRGHGSAGEMKRGVKNGIVDVNLKWRGRGCPEGVTEPWPQMVQSMNRMRADPNLDRSGVWQTRGST